MGLVLAISTGGWLVIGAAVLIVLGLVPALFGRGSRQRVPSQPLGREGHGQGGDAEGKSSPSGSQRDERSPLFRR